MSVSLRSILLLPCLWSLVWSLSILELSLLESTISEDSCSFYQALEMRTHCGNDGYVTNFAHKYCEKYLAGRSSFNDTKWQNGVRVCLQRTMLSKLRTVSQPTCQQIRDWGFDSHFGCYMRPIPNSPEVKFCRLKGADIVKIGWMAKGTVLEKEVWKQFAKMINECAGQYLQDVKQDFVQFLKKTMNSLNWPW
ncbi:unnamed protein product [Adineta ricciae]|uniref:Stanniocalcin-like protein n=1 Tax=Adineta ricciae TaxID=249248 RepID=A0A814ZDZ2_ADIRI|nr:unnamed protein product [Adineta ricciae]CAF1474129.1 unnamed protein product [Adineta ricciae]